MTQMYQWLKISILIAFALPISTLAQHSASKPQTDNTYELWRIRANSITEDLINDGQKLPALRRAVLQARLAESWWRDDPRRAAGWLRSAIESVEQIPNQENATDRRQRLETTGLLLKIAIRLDKKLAQRLVAVLSNKDDSKGTEHLENAENLITAAVSLVEFDPVRAAELGRLALRVGPPTDIAALLFPLYRRDVQLANTLLAQALAVAKQDSSGQLLNSLTYVMFPGQRGLNVDPPAVPEDLRAELLQLNVAFLNANPDATGGSCAAVFGFIAPLLSEFERLIPQQAAVARQAINKCRTSVPVEQQQLQNSSNGQTLNTVEKLLEAAAEAKDLKLRTVFEYRAAALAKKNKDYDVAFKILDGMSKESREFMGGALETYRWDWAAEAALAHYTHGRLLEMNRTLDGVPSDWQAFAKTSFVDRLTDRKVAEDAALQFLNEARVALRRSNLPDAEKYGCYFVLLRLIVKYDPAVASTALKEAIASLNRAEQTADTKDRITLDTSNLSTLPASLLEMDEFAVKEGLTSITSVETRAQLRLDLLQATLQRIKK